MEETEQGQANAAAASSVQQQQQRRKRPRSLNCEDGSNDELFATVQYALDFPSDNPHGMDASGQELPHSMQREHEGQQGDPGQGQGLGLGLAASIHGLGVFDHVPPSSSCPGGGVATAAPVAVGFNNGSTSSNANNIDLLVAGNSDDQAQATTNRTPARLASAIESLISDRAQNGHGHGLVLGILVLSMSGVD